MKAISVAQASALQALRTRAESLGIQVKHPAYISSGWMGGVTDACITRADTCEEVLEFCDRILTMREASAGMSMTRCSCGDERCKKGVFGRWDRDGVSVFGLHHPAE